MLSGIFVASGLRALVNPEALADRAKRVVPLIERVDPRLPSDPRTLVRINGAVQAAGGALLATGHLVRPAAAILAGTLIPATLAGHPFWLETDLARRREHQIHILKNLGLFGGLLLVATEPRTRRRRSRRIT